MRIYYFHADGELRIVRVLHGKRDINPLLEEEPVRENARCRSERPDIARPFLYALIAMPSTAP